MYYRIFCCGYRWGGLNGLCLAHRQRVTHIDKHETEQYQAIGTGDKICRMVEETVISDEEKDER